MTYKLGDSLPGYGDEETWPPCTGHPNDPRTLDDDRDFADLTADEKRARLAELTFNDLLDEALRFADDAEMLASEVERLKRQIGANDDE